MKEYQVNVYANRTEWSLNGKLHREDGPAIEWADGTKYWYLNGKLHREDGPAIECPNGTKSWYLNGRRHREDGPAIEYDNGTKMWYLNGKYHREEEWKKKVTQLKNPCSCDDKVVIIDGKKYKLVAMS
jgi:hypothetical protein